MKIKKAPHCSEMQNMLNSNFSKIYLAGLSIWSILIIIFVLIAHFLEYDKTEMATLRIKAMNDSTFIAHTEIKSSYKIFIKENCKYKFVLNTIENSTPLSLNAKIHNIVVEHAINGMITLSFVIPISDSSLACKIDFTNTHYMALPVKCKVLNIHLKNFKQ